MSIRQDLEVLVWKSRAEKAEELLKRVFGDGCFDCLCNEDECGSCRLESGGRTDRTIRGRRLPDCPYLPLWRW